MQRWSGQCSGARLSQDKRRENGGHSLKLLLLDRILAPAQNHEEDRLNADGIIRFSARGNCPYAHFRQSETSST